MKTKTNILFFTLVFMFQFFVSSSLGKNMFDPKKIISQKNNKIDISVPNIEVPFLDEHGQIKNLKLIHWNEIYNNLPLIRSNLKNIITFNVGVTPLSKKMNLSFGVLNKILDGQDPQQQTLIKIFKWLYKNPQIESLEERYRIEVSFLDEHGQIKNLKLIHWDEIYNNLPLIRSNLRDIVILNKGVRPLGRKMNLSFGVLNKILDGQDPQQQTLIKIFKWLYKNPQIESLEKLHRTEVPFLDEYGNVKNLKLTNWKEIYDNLPLIRSNLKHLADISNTTVLSREINLLRSTLTSFWKGQVPQKNTLISIFKWLHENPQIELLKEMYKIEVPFLDEHGQIKNLRLTHWDEIYNNLPLIRSNLEHLADISNTTVLSREINLLHSTLTSFWKGQVPQKNTLISIFKWLHENPQIELLKEMYKIEVPFLDEHGQIKNLKLTHWDEIYNNLPLIRSNLKHLADISNTTVLSREINLPFETLTSFLKDKVPQKNTLISIFKWLHENPQIELLKEMYKIEVPFLDEHGQIKNLRLTDLDEIYDNLPLIRSNLEHLADISNTTVLSREINLPFETLTSFLSGREPKKQTLISIFKWLHKNPQIELLKEMYRIEIPFLDEHGQIKNLRLTHWDEIYNNLPLIRSNLKHIATLHGSYDSLGKEINLSSGILNYFLSGQVLQKNTLISIFKWLHENPQIELLKEMYKIEVPFLDEHGQIKNLRLTHWDEIYNNLPLIRSNLKYIANIKGTTTLGREMNISSSTLKYFLNGQTLQKQTLINIFKWFYENPKIQALKESIKKENTSIIVFVQDDSNENLYIQELTFRDHQIFSEREQKAIRNLLNMYSENYDNQEEMTKELNINSGTLNLILNEKHPFSFIPNTILKIFLFINKKQKEKTTTYNKDQWDQQEKPFLYFKTSQGLQIVNFSNRESINKNIHLIKQQILLIANIYGGFSNLSKYTGISESQLKTFVNKKYQILRGYRKMKKLFSFFVSQGLLYKPEDIKSKNHSKSSPVTRIDSFNSTQIERHKNRHLDLVVPNLKISFFDYKKGYAKKIDLTDWNQVYNNLELIRSYLSNFIIQHSDYFSLYKKMNLPSRYSLYSFLHYIVPSKLVLIRIFEYLYENLEHIKLLNKERNTYAKLTQEQAVDLFFKAIRANDFNQLNQLLNQGVPY